MRNLLINGARFLLMCRRNYRHLQNIFIKLNKIHLKKVSRKKVKNHFGDSRNLIPEVRSSKILAGRSSDSSNNCCLPNPGLTGKVARVTIDLI